MALQQEPGDWQESLLALREENERFYSTERGQSVLKDLEQTFPHRWLYVSELLQNAIDEGARSIHFHIQGERLVFEHSGNAFTDADIKGLCTRGLSRKGAATVGFMGIGFKSVFRSFQRVDISSGSWRFRLEVPVRKGLYGEPLPDWLGSVRPEPRPELSAPSAGMTCSFVFSRRHKGRSPVAEDLSHVLQEDKGLLPILALRGVEELGWNGETWRLAVEEREEVKPGITRILVRAQVSESDREKRWLIFSAGYVPGAKAIQRLLTHRQLVGTTRERQEEIYREAGQARSVELFCELDERGTPVLPNAGRVYAVLPTEVTLPLSLNVQADWLLVTNRQEVMDPETNSWHDEILSHVPGLVGEYLVWVAGAGCHWWNVGYDALPKFSDAATPFARWFFGERFKLRLKQELKDRMFLPVAVANGYRFVKPSSGVVAPDAFQELEGSEWHPEILLGDRFVSRPILRSAAFQSLQELGFLRPVEPQALARLWGKTRIESWIRGFPKEKQWSALIKLLNALGELDATEAWANTDFVCLPTESGGWVARSEAKRLPGEWQMLTDEEFKADLKALAGGEAVLLRWDFWEAVRGGSFDEQARKVKARAYLEKVTAAALDALVNSWWESLPERPSKEQVGRVLSFTRWIRAKQGHRRILIKKALCEGGLGGPALLPLDQTLLADPYAGASRRLVFSDLPAISRVYLDGDPYGGSELDWRSFFEQGEQRPAGPFKLRHQVDRYARWNPVEWKELRTRLGRVPDMRRRGIQAEWEDQRLSQDDCLVVDASMPPEWERLFSARSLAAGKAFEVADWLAESAREFEAHAGLLAVYVPLGWGIARPEVVQGHRAAWVQPLRETRWVPAEGSEELFVPGDVLPARDEALPDARVARLPVGLMQTLERVGFVFGENISKARAVTRLRVHGPRAPLPELAEMLEDALAEVKEDDGLKAELTLALRQVPLLPADPVDSMIRVVHGRVAWRAGRGYPRGDLGGWIASVERFPTDTSASAILRRVDAFLPFPATTTGEQVIDFLLELWRLEPEVEKVRRTLPTAYEYLVDDLAEESQTESEQQPLRARWAETRCKARVYVQTRHRWMRVSGDEPIYYDDLPDLIWPGKESLALCTLGHLGNTQERQRRAAELLGLTGLTTRFERKWDVLPPRLAAPRAWRNGLERLRSLVAEVRTASEGYDEDEVLGAARPSIPGSRRGTPLQLPPLIQVWGITLSVFDREEAKTVYHREHRASFEEQRGELVVIGDPVHFASDLAPILVNLWGLGQRGGLSGALGALLAVLDNEEAFRTNLDYQMERLNPSGAGLIASAGDASSLRDATQETISATEQGTGPSTTNGTVGEPDRAHQTRPRTAQTTTHAFRDFEETVDAGNHSHLGQGNSAQAATRHAKGARSGNNTSGSSHTEASTADRIQRHLAVINSLLTSGICPQEPDEPVPAELGEGKPDEEFRRVVLEYERQSGRYPVEMGEYQPGYDIESYDKPEGDADRRLARVIEVKGRRADWVGAETVELSRRQFEYALQQAGPGVEFWLYVVSIHGGRTLVLPILNPAAHTSRFSLRADIWSWKTETRWIQGTSGGDEACGPWPTEEELDLGAEPGEGGDEVDEDIRFEE